MLGGEGITVKTKHWIHPLLLGVSFLLVVLFSLSQVRQVSLAQGGDIDMVKVLNRSTNVVRVGEILTFTIALTNNSTFTLTNVTVVDNYDNTTLRFVNALPPEDRHDSGAAVITWSNVAVPEIPPGQGRSITVAFVAEHPRTTVVNAARAQDLVHSSGTLSQTAETSRTQEAVGGAAPVVKFLSPPGISPQPGLPVTFTHIITNDGAAVMTRLPLTDTYDPTFLEFNFAIPPPSITAPPGLLAWTDLTTTFGPIPADTAVVVTTVFTALTRVDNTVNQASTEGALDQYDNELTAGLAQIPITIIDDTPTPTPAPDGGGEDEDDTAPIQPTATATPQIPAPTPTVIIAAEQQFTDTVRFLPETGRVQTGWLLYFLLGGGLLTGGWYLFRITGTEEKG